VLILHIHKQDDMFKFWSILAVASFLFTGCGETSSETETNETEAAQEVLTITTDGEKTAETSAAPAQPVRLNPAHGEPGHDCAIAVGAPLDGSGGKAQPTFNAPTITQPVAQPAVQGQAPANGLNPAHGEPGHDCAIAVGAPLPSK
jgi:ABC-type Fe3+-hydroxamate transport system substrate-binding protein